jgi:acetyl esterase
MIQRILEWAILPIFVVIIFFDVEYLYTQIEDDWAPGQHEVEFRRYIYKNTPQGDLEIRVNFPPGWTRKDKRSAIVFFFGGGWRGGSIDQFKPQAEYFASREMVTARVDYRVKNRQGTLADKCVEDGKSAVRWLRTQAEELGIDEERIVSSGGSAGGHVAACTYIVQGYEAEGEDLSISSRPNLLVLFNPVLDASSATKRIERMGSLEIADDLSPNLHLDKNVPATLMFYGTEDSLLAHGKTFVRKAGPLGIEAILYTAEAQRHGFFNRDPWLSKTIFLMDQFLTKHGYLEGEPTVSVLENYEMVRMESRKMIK